VLKYYFFFILRINFDWVFIVQNYKPILAKLILFYFIFNLKNIKQIPSTKVQSVCFIINYTNHWNWTLIMNLFALHNQFRFFTTKINLFNKFLFNAVCNELYRYSKIYIWPITWSLRWQKYITRNILNH